MPNLQAIHAATHATEAGAALKELSGQLLAGPLPPALVLLFCSPSYDLERLGDAIRQAFPCPVAACTTAGQLGPGGFQQGGMTGIALASPRLKARTYLIEPLEDLSTRCLEVGEQALRDCSGSAPTLSLLFADGLSMKEEWLAAGLHHALEGMVLVGGSAGDDLAFQSTGIYFAGRFRANAAVLVVIQTDHPFKVFKFHHFEPTSTRLVATRADPVLRTVQAFNGKPAAVAYAQAVGVAVASLGPAVFSAHPLLLKVGGDLYLRSIQRVLPDQSLSFYCAIDQAVVFTLARATDPMEAAREAFRAVEAAIPRPAAIIGCDCVLRRLELEAAGTAPAMGALFAGKKVVGFSTYGEQWNGMHVNQTFTGLALGD